MSTMLAPSRLPTLRREGISWHTVGRDLLLRLDFVNESDEPTDDDVLVIEAAPLGAFIPFEPITRLTLAGFEPWERRRVEVAIPLEDLDFTGGPTAGVSFARILEERARFIEWHGNFNVWLERSPETALEVHCAPAGRIPPARDAMMNFIVVGTDRFAAEAWSSAPGWDVRVFRHGLPRLSAAESLDIISVNVTSPDEIGRLTTIEVSFTREADRRTIPVRFDFETVGEEA